MSLAQVVQERRAAGWYELFFDLVFVVVVALAANVIEVNPTPVTVLVFVLLFFPLWWAWVNLMLSVNLYAETFPSTGILLVAAMPGPAAMAIAIAGGIEHNSWLYAAGASWIRLVILAMWLTPFFRGVTRNPLWRPLVYNLVPAAFWLGGAALPEPYRYVAWAIALVIEIVMLTVGDDISEQIYNRASISHALDRLGLFVVIVIGEAVYLSVTALATHPTIAGGAVAVFGFIVCALLARTFFAYGVPTAEVGLLAAQRDHKFAVLRDTIMYLPFLLITALTLVSAGIGVAVEHGEQPLALSARVLLFAGTAGFYVSNAIIGVRLGRVFWRIALLAGPAVVLTALACLPAGLPAWLTLALVAVALGILDVESTILGRSSLHSGHSHHAAAH